MYSVLALQSFDDIDQYFPEDKFDQPREVAATAAPTAPIEVLVDGGNVDDDDGDDDDDGIEADVMSGRTAGDGRVDDDEYPGVPVTTV